MLVVRDKEAGNIITEVKTIKEGEALIQLYEADDAMNNCYTPDFYEVAEIENNNQEA